MTENGAAAAERAGVLAFLRTEAGGGALIALAAALALIFANSPMSDAYFAALKHHAVVTLGSVTVDLTVKEWIKSGLMALFFFVIGLELKREFVVGELSNPRTALAPIVAAFGGAILPPLIYWAIAGGVEPRGWPVPVATDIAFALAALALIAPKADPRLRLFLLTLAVVDDLIAIALIAILFSGGINVAALGLVLAIVGATWVVGRTVGAPAWVYGVAALGAWAVALPSGVHTSLVAILSAFATPVLAKGGAKPVLEKLEHGLHPWSAYLVLPIFAFAAAGVSFAGLSLSSGAWLTSAGIAAGLALGKPIGVSLSVLLVAAALRQKPSFSLSEMLFVGALCGIGFTMSLFIGGLAFAGDRAGESAMQIGVIGGTVVSVLVSAAVWRFRGR